MEFGALEVALEALELLFAASEMAPATELARIPEMELEKALEIAPSSNVSPEALAALASPEEELLSAAKAQKWDPELAPFTSFSCGLKGRKTWPLWFTPFRVTEIWPERMVGEDDRRLARFKIPCGMGLLLRNLGFTTSQVVSQLRNGGSCAVKWNSCAKIAFAATKISRKESQSVAE
ncbi:hypothetical protein CK203_059225 [Vitis vinifera]|uniref:Uncharacterized protein n=1 Tax=Vitis vinifera TaxID=29760 RepID=A0A438GEB7_VITVI|nr:hypothetical protein CK203_059225 [Vitis vinifera]